jgi:thymidylate kinase
MRGRIVTTLELRILRAESEDRRVSSCAAASQAAPVETPKRSAVLEALLADFETRSIAYCYWKSAGRAERALSGASDLDLLIARRDRQRATEILTSQGFKLWPDAPGLDHPSVMSFLGYDEASGLVLNVHAHFRLVLGHSLLKNMRLPIEDQIIARSVFESKLGLRVLDPVDEALLVAARANLDMRGDDPIALRHWAQLERKFADNRAELDTRVDRQALRARAARVFSTETAAAIVERFFDETLTDTATRRDIERELAGFRRYGRLEAFLRAVGRTARAALGKLNRRFVAAPRLPRRRAPGGGVIIAVVGVDGSGKSTLVAEIQRWLGGEIDVLPCYFGTGDGPPAPLFRPIKAIALRVARHIRVKPRGASHGAISDRPPGPLYSTLFVIWALAVALEKRQKLVSGQRAAARGFVVVSDRYPQNEIADFNDGPLLHRVPQCPDWLRRVEASIYALAGRAAPDLVIKLHVGPETVTRREPDMSPAVIRDRIAKLHDLTFSSARILSIDATRPIGEVHRLAKRAVWDIL